MAPKAKRAPKAAEKPTKKAAGAEAPVAPTVILPNPDPPPRPADPPRAAKPMRGLSPLEERLEVEKQIASLQARLWELDHPIIEFPKMVNGHTFNSREEQDAAGPDFADKK